MADETLKPKRQQVKAEDNPPAPTPSRPPLKFIEETLGYKLEAATFMGGLLDMYHAGYFDDENGEALSTTEIRVRAEGYHKSAMQEAARLKREEIRKAQAKAALAARQPQLDPVVAITCTSCKEQFEHLRNMPVKLCADCVNAIMEEEQAKWDAEQQAKKDAEQAALYTERKDWTKDQWDAFRREARKFMNGSALRRSRKRLWLKKHARLARERWKSLYSNPAARELSKRLDAAAERWEAIQQSWRDAYNEAYLRYETIKADDCVRRDIHPKYRYCHNDGLPIPWERNSLFCDDKCEQAVEERGDVHVDTGTRCFCGAMLITDDKPLIDALPTSEYGDEVFHTYECLMSSPDIDEDDYKEFGPDAACWKPLLHVALVKPAHTFKERQKQIMSSPEKVLAMTGGPTAKLMLENPAQAAALMAQWMPKALPAASSKALPAPRVLALDPHREQTETDRVLDFIASAVKDADGYVSLMQVRRGPARIGTRWISNTAARAALDRLTADGRLVKHPTENKWRLA